MRDIANLIMNGLLDGASPESGLADDDRWGGRVSGHRPASDWCQTEPAEDAVRLLATQLHAMFGRGGHRGSNRGI